MNDDNQEHGQFNEATKEAQRLNGILLKIADEESKLIEELEKTSDSVAKEKLLNQISESGKKSHDIYDQYLVAIKTAQGHLEHKDC